VWLPVQGFGRSDRGGGTPPAARAGPIRSLRRFENNEPNIAAPNELPMVRKNVTPEVATPRSSKFEVFCTMSTSTCMDRPMPAPKMTRKADCTSAEVDGSIRDINRNARAISAVPATGKIL
jgi:hypothetical protein